MALINVNQRTFRGQIATVPAALPFRKSAGRSPDPGPLTPETRRNEAFQIRIGAARYHHDVPLIPLVSNGDDASPLGSAGAFGKTLDHNSLGETEPAAYGALLRALDSGRAADFDAIPRGAAGKLANPAASYAFCLEGPYPHQISVPAAPAFASARTAGEMVEVYWQALTRDVPFAEYDVSPAIQQAAGELSRLTDFHGPRIAGQVTPASVFRGGTPGDLAGPYLSQLLWKPVVYGLTTIDQKYRTSV